MNVIVERETRPAAGTRGAHRHAAGARQASSDDVRLLEGKYEELLRDMFGNLTPWERVNMARHPKRPIGSDYLAALDQFDELHGDRHFRDDPAIVGGFAKLRGRRVVAIAQQKGRDTKENIRRNFGMVSPEGYRKAKRLMELASRFALPIVTFVDTSGADPGIASEEHAQAEAIASCLMTLAKARVPVVATIIGEGGWGGALALALADHGDHGRERGVFGGVAGRLRRDLVGRRGARARGRRAFEAHERRFAGFGIVDEIVARAARRRAPRRGSLHRPRTARRR